MKRLYSAVAFLLMSGSLFAQTVSAPPVFSKDVAPIIFTHCTTCHRPNSIAPFPLQTYQDVSTNAYSIVVDIQSKKCRRGQPALTINAMRMSVYYHATR